MSFRHHLSSSLYSGTTRGPKLSQGALVTFRGEWELVTKVWALLCSLLEGVIVSRAFPMDRVRKQVFQDHKFILLLSQSNTRKSSLSSPHSGFCIFHSLFYIFPRNLKKGLNLLYSWSYYENKIPRDWCLFPRKWGHSVDHKFRAEVKARAPSPGALKNICTDRRVWRETQARMCYVFSIFSSHFTMNVCYS